MEGKKAIIVASFGTSYAETRSKTLDRIESDIADAFPDRTVRRAFTSRMIIRKMKERDGIHVDYIDEALQRLVDEGYDDVVVLPSLVFNGIEFDDIVRISSTFSSRFENLRVAKPLLTTESDFDKLVDIITGEILKDSKDIAGEGSSLVMMGHGTDHFANGAFSEIQLKLTLTGCDDVFITTVEGFPRFTDLEKMMERDDSKDVVLIPLMLVAGDHAMNDMSDDSPDSLRGIMESSGRSVHLILKGLAEYESIRRMFIQHISDVIGD